MLIHTRTFTIQAYIYIHTKCIHTTTHIATNACMYTHADMYTRAHAGMYTCIHAHMHSHMHACTRVLRTHTCALACTD